jgi:glutaconyl-CoA decarboxylase
MRKFKVKVNGKAYEVEVEEVPSPYVSYTPRAAYGPPPEPSPRPQEKKTEVKAPMPGRIIAVRVKRGDAVQLGQALVVMEAMKMENEIPSPVAGTVVEIKVAEGDSVRPGEVLVVLE